MPDQEKSVVGSQEELIIGQELKLADKLAVERTVLAADRTMLAGGISGSSCWRQERSRYSL
jgi:hypothetical protein